MKLPSNKVLAFNGAAIMVMGLAAISFLKTFLVANSVPPCSARYPNAVALGVERNGELVQASDIQAAAGGFDAGLLEHLTLTRVKSGPADSALEILLPAGSAHPQHTRQPRGGIVLPWQPRSLPPAVSAACLSYDIFLPADFEFGTGIGTLPGMFGSSPSEGRANNEHFTIHFGWDNRGNSRSNVTLHAGKRDFPQIVEGKSISRGRWVRVEQEAILNTPGKYDGKYRIWMDGDLQVEHPEIGYRLSGDASFEGVAADVYFGSSTKIGDGHAAKDERIMLTPFELRWK